MIVRKLQTDHEVQQVLHVLRREYSKDHPKAIIEAYRHDDHEIRIRILDPNLKKVHITKRTRPVWDILRKHLPEKIREQILFLILLTPSEAKRSAMSMEFDDPLPDGE